MIEVILYLESTCPYCNYVHKYILRDIQIRRSEINRKLRKEGLPPIPRFEIRVIDVDANVESKYMKWYEWYSKRIGGRYTPLIKIGNKVFYLWGEKSDVLESEKISEAELLKSQIIEELQDIAVRVEKEPTLVGEIKPDIQYLNHKVLDKTKVPAFWV